MENVTEDLDGVDMWSSLSNGSPSPRTEILLNIDHDRDIYGFRKGEWKLLIGTTYNGSRDGWYPPGGAEEPDVQELAAKCGLPRPKMTPCEPLVSPCLFNMKTDPCELDNVAVEYPTILEEMMARLQKYNATVVPPRNKPADDRASPKYHDGVWSPWM